MRCEIRYTIYYNYDNYFHVTYKMEMEVEQIHDSLIEFEKELFDVIIRSKTNWYDEYNDLNTTVKLGSKIVWKITYSILWHGNEYYSGTVIFDKAASYHRKQVILGYLANFKNKVFIIDNKTIYCIQEEP